MIFQSLVRETIETSEILSRFHFSHISSEIFCFLKVAHYFFYLNLHCIWFLKLIFYYFSFQRYILCLLYYFVLFLIKMNITGFFPFKFFTELKLN